MAFLPFRFSMSSAIDDDMEDGWCIDTDGLNFGISRNEKYFSYQLKTKDASETVADKDSLYPLRNSFRHSYVNTKSDEGILESELLNSACLNIETIINQEHLISYNLSNERRSVCNKRNYTTNGLKKSLRIGIIMMVNIFILMTRRIYLNNAK